MANKREIVNLTSQLESIRNLVETYEEISAIHMRNIRSGVLTSRSFIDNLEVIYKQLQKSYQLGLREFLKKKQKGNIIISKKNGKSIVVLLSANTGLSGDIIKRTFDEFNKYIHAHDTDIAIIGTQGKRLMEEFSPDKKFNFYELPDVNITPEKLFGLIGNMLEYEHIYLFYAKFQTFMSQIPFMLDVYGESLGTNEDIPFVHYLFEPNLEKILQFFEEQIFSTIIEQTFRESELAKHAARMVALDEATQNINNKLKRVNLQKRILEHHLQNQKQQQAFSSMKLWKLR